jgi:hypothetical protein
MSEFDKETMRKLKVIINEHYYQNHPAWNYATAGLWVGCILFLWWLYSLSTVGK